MLGTQHDRRILFRPPPPLHAEVEGSSPNKNRILWWVARRMIQSSISHRREGVVTSFTDKRANAFSFALMSYHVSSSSSVPEVERFFCLLRLRTSGEESYFALCRSRRLDFPFCGFERFFFFRGYIIATQR